MQPTASEVQSVADVWRFAGVLLFALTSVQPLFAQFPPEIAARTRVRVMVPGPSLRDHEAEGGWIVGEVARVQLDTLHVRVDSVTPVAIPRTAIQRLQRSLGTRTLATCTRAGQVVGGIIGASFIVVGFTSDAFTPLGAAALLVAFWGGTINALSRAECWRNVPLR